MKGISVRIIIIALFACYSCKSVKPVETDNRDSPTPKEEITDAQELPESGEVPEQALDTAALMTVDTLLVETSEPEIDSISVIGVGDIMMGTNFPGPEYLPPDSGKYLLDGVAEILQSADITFGNLEGVLLDDGGEPKN